MNRRHTPPTLLRVAVTAVWLATVGVAGQGCTGESDLLRTSWGDPDLQGVWNNNTIVPLERPAAFADTDLLTDEEVAARFQQTSDIIFAEREGDTGFYNEFWFEYGQDTNRTSLIVDPADGRLPALTPLAQAKADAEVSHFLLGGSPIASWEDLPLPVRCITRGLPGTMSPGFGYNHNYQIFQTPTYVAILSELIHDVRIIPLDGRPHVGNGIRQWLGDSRGRWEEGTLVVETTNFTDKANTRGPTVFGGSADLRLVERFTRVDANTIDYGYTFEDPTTFTAPWTAAIPMRKVEGPVYEYACHEGNYSLPGMLVGGRAEQVLEAGPSGSR